MGREHAHANHHHFPFIHVIRSFVRSLTTISSCSSVAAAAIKASLSFHPSEILPTTTLVPYLSFASLRFHTPTRMQPPTGRRREPPGAGAATRGGQLTRQQPPPAPAGPGRLFFMPPPAPPGQQHRRPPQADRDRPFFMPPPAPPGRSHSNQPSPSDPPPSASTSTRPLPPPPPPPQPPHAYRGDYDPAEEGPGLRRPPSHQPPLPPPHPHPLRRPSSSPCSSALSSCLVATAFLLLSAGGAGAALFLLFRPRPPDIAVAAVRLPSFSASNGTVAFTFEQTATVRNPNRSPLAHFDSSLRVAYAGGDLGAVYIPAGLIDGGRTKHVSAVFDVPAIPVAAQPTTIAASAAQQQSQPPVIEVHSLLVVNGRVNVLRVLTHRVQAAKLCRVGVSPLDGTVLGFRC